MLLDRKYVSIIVFYWLILCDLLCDDVMVAVICFVLFCYFIYITFFLFFFFGLQL